MKLEPAKDKFESLYQGFILLFTSTSDTYTEEVTNAICFMLMDPEITAEQASNACNKAVQILLAEQNLINSYKGTINGLS